MDSMSTEDTGSADTVPFTRQSHTPIPIPVVPTTFRSSVGSVAAAVSRRDTADRYRQTQSAADSSGLGSQNVPDTRGMPPPSRAEFEMLKKREMQNTKELQKALFYSSLEADGDPDGDDFVRNAEALGIPLGFIPGRRRASALGGAPATPSEPVATTSNDSTSGVPPSTMMTLPGPSAQTPANDSSPAMATNPTQHGYSRSHQDQVTSPLPLSAVPAKPPSSLTSSEGATQKIRYGHKSAANILQLFRIGLVKKAAQETTNPPSENAGTMPMPGHGTAPTETTQPVAAPPSKPWNISIVPRSKFQDEFASGGETAQVPPAVGSASTMLMPETAAAGTAGEMTQGTANAGAPMTGVPTTLTMRPATQTRLAGSLDELLPSGWVQQGGGQAQQGSGQVPQQTSQQGLQVQQGAGQAQQVQQGSGQVPQQGIQQASAQNPSTEIDPEGETMPIDPRLFESNP